MKLREIERLQMAWYFYEEEYDIAELAIMYQYGDWYVKQAINKYRHLYLVSGTEA